MLDAVRTRLTLWYVGVLALVLVAFCAGVYLLLKRSLESRLDTNLRTSVEAIARMIPHELTEGESAEQAATSAIEELYFPRQSVAIFGAGGKVLAEKTAAGETPARLPETVPSSPGEISFFTLPETGGHEDDGRRGAFERMTAGNSTYVIVASQSLEAVSEELEAVQKIFFMAVPVALLLAGLGGWLLARQSLAPVVSMSEQARRISGENISGRLPVANPRDELGRLAATFNEMLARLEASFDQQRQFMADASHEMRTPLHVVRTAAEVTLEQPHRDEHEYREALAMIGDQARRLTRIVEDMFTLARADAGRRALEKSDFYLDELLAETVRAASVLAARKGVAVEVAESAEVIYRGDEDLLRQMLLNLLDNAIRHTPPGGAVRIHLRRENGKYLIKVADTGAGIPVEAQPHIFERFYRADK